MRKSKPKKRYFLPDPIYKDTLVTQFVNNLMHDGKKSVSYSIFYDSLKIVEDKTKEKGLEVWKKACLLYTSPSPRDRQKSRMPSSA